jgi:hypothetical protein
MSEEDSRILTFQDLGELKQIVRFPDETGSAGVETLLPDEAASHGEALAEIREVVDKYYGGNFDRLADEDERVVVERFVAPSDDLPYIEYRVVDDREVEE